MDRVPGRKPKPTSLRQIKIAKSNIISCTRMHTTCMHCASGLVSDTRSNHRVASWQKNDQDYVDIVQGLALAELSLKTSSITRSDVSHFEISHMTCACQHKWSMSMHMLPWLSMASSSGGTCTQACPTCANFAYCTCSILHLQVWLKLAIERK